MKDVTLIIPAYNEEKRIESAASALFSSPYLKEKCNFLFIVDGEDKTGEILENLDLKGADAEIKKYSVRLGKGGAVGEGIKAAKTEYAGFIDVDEHIPAETVEKMVGLLLGEKLDCVICSRKGANRREIFRGFASRAFNLIVNLLFGIGLRDTQCGCKLFRRDLVYS
ncbi:glycosyltransferase, partial [Candidatus Micrarchaeota archaeon]|nr:glycosyltransferase [Candidatus Micrarchaeota archaeon]MBD3417405.1 glycosyltransferase [Candidatus Micrarchaeota archaeon]